MTDARETLQDILTELADMQQRVAALHALVRRAYAAGRRDALARILDAAASEEAEPFTGPGVIFGKAPDPPIQQMPSGRVAPGGIKNAVRAMVIEAGARGITDQEITSRMPADTKRSSRYMAIRTLLEAGEIERRDGRLFPAQKAAETGSPEPASSTRVLDL